MSYERDDRRPQRDLSGDPQTPRDPWTAEDLQAAIQFLLPYVDAINQSPQGRSNGRPGTWDTNQLLDIYKQIRREQHLDHQAALNRIVQHDFELAPGSGPKVANDHTGKSVQEIVQSFFGTLAPTSQSIDQILAALKSAGYDAKRATHANGTLPSDDKIVVNGSTYDLIRDVGGPNASWWFGTDSGTGTTAGQPMVSASTFGELTRPFGGSFTPPATAAQIPGLFTGPAYERPPAFMAPTFEDAQQEPGYRFALEEGRRALEQSAAGRGTLLTGGTLKDILHYGQDAAAKNYQSVYDRKLNAYLTNYGTQYVQPYEFAYRAARDQHQSTQDAFTNAQSNYQNAWQRYLQGWNEFKDQRDSTFDKRFKVTTA
jgi:hypothetical protein